MILLPSVCVSDRRILFVDTPRQNEIVDRNTQSSGFGYSVDWNHVSSLVFLRWSRVSLKSVTFEEMPVLLCDDITAVTSHAHLR